MKYDDNLINDYINGNDMDDDILEQLEDNTDFMIEVIKKSNDKNDIINNEAHNEIKVSSSKIELTYETVY